MSYVPEPEFKFATSLTKQGMRNRQKSRDQIIFNSMTSEMLALEKKNEAEVSITIPDDYLATSMQVQQIKDLLVDPNSVGLNKRIQNKTSLDLR